MPRKSRPKKKEKKNIANGVVHIRSTFNNTIVTITDTNGDTLCYASAGMVGFKGSRKSTPFAAQLAAEDAAKQVLTQGMRKVEVHVKGPGAGREAAGVSPAAPAPRARGTWCRWRRSGAAR